MNAYPENVWKTHIHTYTHDTHSTDWILFVQNMSLVKLITSKDDNPTICE